LELSVETVEVRSELEKREKDDEETLSTGEVDTV
jgi:hypothetical protein